MWKEIVKDGLPEKEIPYIAYGKNSHGKGRKIKAVYIPKFSHEDDGDYEGDGDYSEEKDCYFWPEGWYEWNLSDETNYFVGEIDITHYTEFPADPEKIIAKECKLDDLKRVVLWAVTHYGAVNTDGIFEELHDAYNRADKI